MFNKKTNFLKSGFTLIELLVVIAIIGILSTLSVVALQSVRGKARDAKRITDIRQIQTALELYFNDQSEYPASVTAGSSIASGSNTYMYTVPDGPTPADGDCATSSYVYTQVNSGADYYIEFCLGGNVADMPAGIKCAFSGGIIPTTTTCY
ncbi:MAG: type II secretion system protein [Candidatus Colwellbacteria bacterium]|nr:type II secretion system protein [Candidatus Colwellbacteria bacterium]